MRHALSSVARNSSTCVTCHYSLYTRESCVIISHTCGTRDIPWARSSVTIYGRTIVPFTVRVVFYRGETFKIHEIGSQARLFLFGDCGAGYRVASQQHLVLLLLVVCSLMLPIWSMKAVMPRIRASTPAVDRHLPPFVTSIVPHEQRERHFGRTENHCGEHPIAV